MYKALKQLILSQYYNKENIISRINNFKMRSLITEEEQNELLLLCNQIYDESEEN